MSRSMLSRDKIYVKYRKISPSDLKYDEKFLERGTYGDVRKATWQEKSVAVKMFSCADRKGGFSEELISLSMLHEHANIVNLHGAHLGDTKTDKPFIVLEFAPYSLEKVLHQCRRELKYTADHVMSWTVQMAVALEFIHSQDMLHRDVTPSNILLFQDGCVLKLCDFGTARKLEHTLTNAVGTLWYMAPEVIRGTYYTTSCDVYSFGVVLWEMITRHKPYLAGIRGKSMAPFNVLYRVAAGGRPPMISRLPKCLEELIKRCWDEGTHKRPTTLEIKTKMERLVEIIKVERGKPLIRKRQKVKGAGPGCVASQSDAFAREGRITPHKSSDHQKSAEGVKDKEPSSAPLSSPLPPLPSSTDPQPHPPAPPVTATMSDEEATKIVEKAMESGYIKQRNTAAIVTGIMGAGKSTFLKRLFRQDISTSYTSTGVTGESYRGVMCHLATMGQSGHSLKYLPRGEILEFLASHLELGGDVEALAQDFRNAHLRHTLATTTPLIEPQPEPTSSQDTFVEEESADCLELDLIHMLDIGGQPECMEVMPTLIHNSDLVVLVMNLEQGRKSLECCADEETECNKSTLLQHQNKQIIPQLIHTIQAEQCRSNWKGQKRSYHSRLLVIGTHSIKLEEYSNVLEACSKGLKKLLEPLTEDEKILYEGSLIFPLNLQNPEEAHNVLDYIRKSIKLPDVEEFDLPPSFFVFQQCAHKCVEDKKRPVKVLSLTECEEIGARLKMSRETVQAALLYLHKHNVFLYFQDIFQDLVFLDPQEPLELVNSIVRLSYKTKANKGQGLAPGITECLTEGTITEELLKNPDLSLCFVPDVYQPHHAITLLQKIYTIAPLGKAKRKKKYVMMCLLSDKTKDVICHILPNKPHISPLLVQFDKDCIPKGCFGTTISCLITNYGWDLLHTSKRKPQCLAHNIVIFSGTPKVPMEITLVSSTEYFEVHVNPEKKEYNNIMYCTQIRSNVFSAVKEVLEMMHYDIGIEPAFLCPCDPTEPHAATVTPPLSSSSDLTLTRIKCTVTNKRHNLKDEQKVWIEKWNNQEESFSLQIPFPHTITPPKSDKEIAEIVKKEMESGCIKQRNTMAIVTGIMGAEKSTFLKKLFQQYSQSSYTSTEVTGESYRGVMGHLASLRLLEYMPRGRILQFLDPLLKVGVPEGDVEAAAQIIMDARAVSTPQRVSASSPIVPFATKTLVSESQPGTTYAENTLRDSVKKLKEKSLYLKLDLIHMLDTGGQPECMEVMPTLIHNSDLVILVLNLARGLECYTTPFCAEEGTQYEKSTLLRRQNKQIIRQLIRTMQAKRAKKEISSKFLVVGTHRDCIKPAEEYNGVLEACSKELKKLFGQAVHDVLIVYEGKCLMFPLNLKDQEPKDKEVLEIIRNHLNVPNVKEFDLPLSFFMFEHNAHKYVEGDRRPVKVLSLKECEEVGARLKMSRETVQAALLYLHIHNVFLYFQDILPDLVFLDPQEPLELVNSIVRFSYKAKSNKGQGLTPGITECLSEGTITEELLKHNDLSLCFVPDMYQPCDAITLFQKICTIAPLGEAKREKEYVMMCLLPDKTEDEIRSLLPSSPRVPPLLVHFENDCAPIGCFGNTVSWLIMKYGWDLLRTLERTLQCLAHNIVQFSDTPTVPMEITLVSCTGYFEVHVNPKNSQEEKHCPEICLDVVSAIENVLHMMHYNISIKPAFLCPHTHTPCNSTEPHATTEPDATATEPDTAATEPDAAATEPDATATEPHAAAVIPSSTNSSTSTPATIKCTITKKRYNMNDKQRVWIEKRSDQTESMDDRPTLNELMNFGEGHVNIIEAIGDKYNKFGTLLLKDKHGGKVGAIKHDERRAEDINNTVLTRWIRGEGRKPTSWATLATVLDECQLSTFADIIRSVKATSGST